MTKRLFAYPGGAAQRDALLASLAEHRAADHIIKGQYWRDGKGCSVGCALVSLGEAAAAEAGDHALLGRLTGYGEQLQRLNDVLFEALPNDLAMDWPLRFAAAAQPGADLTLVPMQFTHRTLARLLEQSWIDVDLRTTVQPILDGLAILATNTPLTAAQQATGDKAAWEAWEGWAAPEAWEEWAAREAREAEVKRQADDLITLIGAAPIAEQAQP